MGKQAGADRVCYGEYTWCDAWLTSKSTSWSGSVLWEGSHSGRSWVTSLVTVVVMRRACLSEVLKMSVRTSVSCSAHSFCSWPGMLSGPPALGGLVLDWVFLCRLMTDRSPGHWEVWLFSVQICHSVFQPVHSSQVVECIWGGCVIITDLWQGWSVLSVKWLLIYFYFFVCDALMLCDRLALVSLRTALSPDLNATSQVFNSPRTSAVNHGFWLAHMVMVLVTVTISALLNVGTSSLNVPVCLLKAVVENCGSVLWPYYEFFYLFIFL